MPGRQAVQEYGRLYGTFRRGQYMLPHDRMEADRLDTMEEMISQCRPPGDSRFTSVNLEPMRKGAQPLEERVRILDLGCGSGIWMNKMARYLPNAEIVGLDLHYQAADFVPPNVSIRAPWDYEAPWALGEESWDMIHLQMGQGSVADWIGLYQKVIRHLVPGTGVFEQAEIDFEPRCDDGSLPPDARLVDWWHRYLKGSYDIIGRRITYEPNTGEMLKAVGFRADDINHQVYRIPLRPTDPDSSRLGALWQISMASGDDAALHCGLEAMSLRPLCSLNGWPAEHVKRLCQEASQDAAHPAVNAYNNLHIWTARAPPKS
ncbi:hypothetical protein H2204_000563 [Knufia peltigerae]|uniref:Methyltransferase n=1 Tax=Knufia peltigerae TaxID=1002370 RepID=A0AA38YEX9_9EURO|nr:hypothetical protein H2204_000563 [Knufia peltigerae]